MRHRVPSHFNSSLTLEALYFLCTLYSLASFVSHNEYHFPTQNWHHNWVYTSFLLKNKPNFGTSTDVLPSCFVLNKHWLTLIWNLTPSIFLRKAKYYFKKTIFVLFTRGIANWISNFIGTNKYPFLHIFHLSLLIFFYIFRRNYHLQGCYTNFLKTYSDITVLRQSHVSNNIK